MADQAQGSSNQSAGDRRGRDRRNTDRRTPLPPWRRPWALVAYGVAAALVLVLVVGALRDDPEPEPLAGALVTETPRPAVEPVNAATAATPVEDASTAADFERLVAEGDEATGRRVRAELFCSTISSVALRDKIPQVNAAVAALRDDAGRVPAAQCRWGEDIEIRREDLLLLVPPELAERFASAPEVETGFVQRRRITGVVEWVGRSDALALRPTAVLRSF